MKMSIITAFLLSLLISTPALAEKPEWAGKKGQPTEEQKKAHKEVMTQKQQGGSAPDSIKGMPRKSELPTKTQEKIKSQDGEKSMLEQRLKSKPPAERQEKIGTEDGKKSMLESMQQKKSGENATEAVDNAQQTKETTEKPNKWYQFWKK